MIPALIRKCVTARREGRDSIEVWGTGNASREFLYVDDCAEGIFRAAALYDGADPVNLGTGDEITIRDLVHAIVRISEIKGAVRWQSDKPDGQPRRRLDTSRAERYFGFRAKTSLEEGLTKTIAWFGEADGRVA